MKLPLLPLFDNIANVSKNEQNVILPPNSDPKDFFYCLSFLKNYTGSQGTFNSYRRETERLLHWSWQIKNTNLASLRRDDIEQFIRFCQSPPPNWISLQKVPRFIEEAGKRIPNEAWRPFVATLSKSQRKEGKVPSIEQFKLAQGSIQEIFSILSTLFNFLIAEEYLQCNPIALIRQKSKFIRKQQQSAPIRRLSLPQWETVLAVADGLADKNPEKHERTRFILSALFGMYLRISELSATPHWIPTMNNFAKDVDGQWWFTTVGKGNKERQIAVSAAMLASLARWRKFLGLTPLPNTADTSPLLPKLRGNGPMSDPAPIRRLIQLCFDLAADRLRQMNKHEDADNLLVATVHWLRHTGISEDVKTRPREHVRDDAGHSSSATTDRYIDVERKARYESAQKKQIEVKHNEEKTTQ